MQTYGRWYVLLILCLAVMIAACDAIGTVAEEPGDEEEESDPSSTATVIDHYAGPGSRWDVKLMDDDSFTVTYRDSLGGAVEQTVWGTYERLPSGFLTMTVDSAAGEEAPAPGDQAYALDIPGFAFVLHPRDADDSPMHLLVAAGECPTETMDGNWVMVKDGARVAATEPEAPFFGTFYYDPNSQLAKIPSMYSLAAFAPTGTTEPADGAQCADGVVDLPDAEMYVTASGMMTVRLNVEDGANKIIFGVPNEQTDGLDALDGEYAGLLFNNHATERKVTPVHTSCQGGTCTGVEVTDVETGAEAAEGAVEITLDAPNELAPGLITGSIQHSAKQGSTDEASTAHVACAASTKVLDTERNILSCVGMSPDNPEHLFNVLLTSVE